MSEVAVPVARKRSRREDGPLHASRSALRMVNGRLVSLSLHDPVVKQEVQAKMAERRKDPAALRAYYVKEGVITPTGRLTKRYGG